MDIRLVIPTVFQHPVKGIGREAHEKQACGLGLVFVGGPDDKERSDKIAAARKGPTLNLCGKPLRWTAAILRRSKMFIGGDGGMMHLAASQGVPCIAAFSARDLPGAMAPFGEGHKVLYHRTPCFGCKVWECTEHDKKCIRAITPGEAIAATWKEIGERTGQPAGEDS